MSKVQERKLISDAMWEKLETAVAAAKHSAAGAPPDLTDREVLEALLNLNRTGSPWRDFPPEFRFMHAVYMRLLRCEERGGWQRLLEKIQAQPSSHTREL